MAHSRLNVYNTDVIRARDAFEYTYGEAVKLGQARAGMTYEDFFEDASPRLLK